MRNINGICFSCCQEKKLSEEHIIPQALGGKLSAWIYCKDCNDQFGKEIDSELIKRIGYLGIALGIKRERGKSQSYDVTSVKNGTELTFDGKEFKRKKPVVKIEKESNKVKSVDIRARTQEELKRLSANISKKYGLTDEIKHFEEHHPGPTDTVTELVFDNPLIRRCISKIAYSLVCTKLTSDIVLSDFFDEIRNYIRFGSTTHLATVNYVHTSFMTDNIRPLHKVHISLNRSKCLIIGFVSLFGTFRYTALLSRTFKSSFDWPGLDHTIDPVTYKFITGNPNFRAPELKVDEVLFPKHSKELVLEELEKGHKIIENYVNGHKFLKIEVDTHGLTPMALKRH